LKENEAPKDLIFQTVNQQGILEDSPKRRPLDQDYFPNSSSNINRSSTIRGDSDKKLEKIVLKGNPVGLVCQNINYFIGGPADAWRNSVDKFGLEVYDSEMKIKDNNAQEVN
jgi:hypothetical protein